ncbi:MAG: hypothetical protein L3J57_11255 [Desulfuromusa sp.]|nr:hypothetical protein [Desulfuromusa sp.]
MIHIHNMQDCLLLTSDPDLFREVTSYLLYCCYEVQDDDQDFSFSILQEEDLPMLNDLSPPEETVQIRINADGMVLTMYRIVYPTEVLFIPAEISHLISF